MRYSPEKVRRLIAGGVLEQVRFGALVRVTPESVAAYEQLQDAKAAQAATTTAGRTA